MKKLIWRIRYTIYGQRRCRIGWRNWWCFSGAYEDGSGYFDYSEDPREMAQEEIYYMAADAR